MGRRLKVFCVALMLVLFSVSALAETATGTASGFHGDVSVTLSVEDGKINACEIVGEGETPAIGGLALEHYRTELINRNSVDLDTFSGATITSNAVLEAAASALAEMELTAQDLTAIEIEKGATQELQADVVVVGAGLSGLTAAIELQENGTNVILLEKNAIPGGSSRLSGCYMISPSEQTTAEEMLAWMNKETASLTDRETRRNQETLMAPKRFKA